MKWSLLYFPLFLSYGHCQWNGGWKNNEKSHLSDLVELSRVVYFSLSILMSRFSYFISFSASFPSLISYEIFAAVCFFFFCRFVQFSEGCVRILFFSSSSAIHDVPYVIVGALLCSQRSHIYNYAIYYKTVFSHWNSRIALSTRTDVFYASVVCARKGVYGIRESLSRHCKSKWQTVHGYAIVGEVRGAKKKKSGATRKKLRLFGFKHGHPKMRLSSMNNVRRRRFVKCNCLLHKRMANKKKYRTILYVLGFFFFVFGRCWSL